jgi:pimeloyl-ACP methyl ester carboxylesterase
MGHPATNLPPARARRIWIGVAAIGLAVLGPLASVWAGPALASSPSPPTLALSSCLLTHPSRIATVEAQCGVLIVPEDPAAPHGRQITLRVARVAAINLRKRPDPLFVLAGGPGMAATIFYTSAAGALAAIHRDRDIVLVDQRGTGGSNALTCSLDDDTLWQPGDRRLGAQIRRCLDSLRPRADVRFYTTSIAVEDLERVRRALGYGPIDLYGVSYGTRVAQHYLRRHPGTTRAVILDGVVPAQEAVGASLALDAESALARIFERCSADTACRARFGNPDVAYRRLRTQLAQRAVSVQVSDPVTDAPVTFQFGALHLAAVLRLSSYTAEQAALLPLLLDSASAHGNLQPLAAQFLLLDRSYGEALAYGMHNAVVCSEDVPFYGRLDRERLAATYLGPSQVDALSEVCALWPRGPVDPDFHQPLSSARPVLLLSGSDDPVTPPANASLAAGGLTDHVIVQLQGMGHGQLTAPCIGELMARFLEAGTTRGLDTSCAQRDRPLPFFISFAGPPP